MISRVRARHWYEYPYTMLKIVRGQPVVPESLASSITRETLEPSGSRFVRGVPQQRAAVYKPAQDVVEWNITQTLVDGRALRIYAAMRVVSYGFVGLYVYGPASDSTSTSGSLDSLIDGLHIDEVYAYHRPPPASPEVLAEPSAFRNPAKYAPDGTGRSLALGALAAAGLGLGVFAVFALAGRQRQ
jgi:hypothetical protein